MTQLVCTKVENPKASKVVAHNYFRAWAYCIKCLGISETQWQQLQGSSDQRYPNVKYLENGTFRELIHKCNPGECPWEHQSPFLNKWHCPCGCPATNIAFRVKERVRGHWEQGSYDPGYDELEGKCPQCGQIIETVEEE